MLHSRSTVHVTRTLDTPLGVVSAAPAAAGILPLQEPASSTRLIVIMVLHQGKSTHPVRVLQDTGCSIPLINWEMATRLPIPLRKHKEPRIIENYEGKTVQGASSHYTNTLPLHHDYHYSQERFEVSPMEAGIDIFLPYRWIKAHPPQGQWDPTAKIQRPGMPPKVHQI